MTDFGNHICGCYYTVPHPHSPFRIPQRRYLPQVLLDSHTTITPLYFTTRLSQTFTNPSGNPLPETRYTFPLYDGVAVTAFTCTIGDKVIKGHVQQKEQARKTYDAAVQRGESAGLLESLPFGVFGVTLGNIPTNASVRVDIVYGGELKHDAQIDGLRYILPTSIAPRYGAYPGQLLQADTATPKGLRITVDVDMEGSAVRKIQCPSKDHPIAVSIGNLSTDIMENTIDLSRASVTLAHDTSELGSDFVLQILIDDIASPKAILEKHTSLNRHALMTTFVPKFNLKPIRPEIIFIADQSGSMSGAKNTALVTALKTFIKSLPSGVRFNLAAFGSTEKFLWRESKPYNGETAAEALDFVKSFRADLGGTHLFTPIKTAFESRLTDLPLELIVLTDGEITAEQQLFDFVTKQIHENGVDARCFVLGVGRDVSHTLVEGFARAGNGVCQFVTTDEIMDYKVVRMLKAALYPHVKDYKLDIEYEPAEHDDFEMVENVVEKDPLPSAEQPEKKQTPISLFDTSVDLSRAPNQDNSEDPYAHLPTITTPQIIQAPHQIPALLPFNRTTVHLLFQEHKQIPKSVILRGTCSEGPLELKIPVQKIDSPDNVVNSLAAKRTIQELEEGRGWLVDAQQDAQTIKDKYPSRFDELVEREVVRLGIDYQVANKWCSFVAVAEKDKDKENITQTPSSHTVSEGLDQKSSEEDCDMGFFSVDENPPARARAARRRVASRSSCDDGRGGMMLQRQIGGDGGPMSLQQQQPLVGCLASTPPTQVHAMPNQVAMGRGIMASFAPSQAFTASRSPAYQSASSFGHVGAKYKTGSNIFAWSDPSPSPSQDEDNVTSIPIGDTLAAVRALINLQNFDGSWDWSDVLAQFFGEPISSHMKGSLDVKLSATALVLAWLQLNALGHQDLWEMVAEKGVEWIEQKQPRSTAIEQAKSALTAEFGSGH